MEKKVPQPSSPFKFNHVWLENEDYRKLVQLNSIPTNEDDGRSSMDQFTSNIANIKNVSSKWAKEFYKKESETLREVESAIGVLMIDRSTDSLPKDEESRWADLQKKKQELLANEGIQMVTQKKGDLDTGKGQ